MGLLVQCASVAKLGFPLKKLLSHSPRSNPESGKPWFTIPERISLELGVMPCHAYYKNLMVRNNWNSICVACWNDFQNWGPLVTQQGWWFCNVWKRAETIQLSSKKQLCFHQGHDIITSTASYSSAKSTDLAHWCESAHTPGVLWFGTGWAQLWTSHWKPQLRHTLHATPTRRGLAEERAAAILFCSGPRKWQGFARQVRDGVFTCLIL